MPPILDKIISNSIILLVEWLTNNNFLPAHGCYNQFLSKFGWNMELFKEVSENLCYFARVIFLDSKFWR